MKYAVELYEKDNKKIPVFDFILSLNPKQQAKIYREIELLETFGNELHFPHVEKMEGKYNKLWELRIEISSNIFRIFYFLYYQNKVILLHGFQKKTEKTPIRELDTALNYMNNFLKRIIK